MKLFFSLLIPLAVGAIAGFFTSKAIPDWYAQLNKPWFNPPNWIFGPVWTTLYILMGISMWLVWKSNTSETVKQPALYFFAVQLVLNFFWSIIFFKQEQIGWALVEIGMLWIFILITIFAFSKIDARASWLLVPYISWVSFAAILNYSIWTLNRT